MKKIICRRCGELYPVSFFGNTVKCPYCQNQVKYVFLPKKYGIIRIPIKIFMFGGVIYVFARYVDYIQSVAHAIAEICNLPLSFAHILIRFVIILATLFLLHSFDYLFIDDQSNK